MNMDEQRGLVLAGLMTDAKDDEQAAKALRMVRANPGVLLTRLGSRAELIKRLAMLPDNIQKGIAEKRIQLVDQVYYGTRSIDGLTSGIQIFKAADNEEVGVTNVNNQKLQKDFWFLLDSVQLQYGTGATAQVAAFGAIPTKVKNGEFELLSAGKNILPKCHCEPFANTRAYGNFQYGLNELSNPKLIEPNSKIEFNIDLSAAGVANEWLKGCFIGTGISPNS